MVHTGQDVMEAPLPINRNWYLVQVKGSEPIVEKAIEMYQKRNHKSPP